MRRSSRIPVIIVTIAILCFLIVPEIVLAQVNTQRNPGPGDLSLGVKILLAGGVIWGIGMLLLMSSNSIAGKQSSNPVQAFGGVCAVVGGLIAFAGILVMGF